LVTLDDGRQVIPMAVRILVRSWQLIKKQQRSIFIRYTCATKKARWFSAGFLLINCRASTTHWLFVFAGTYIIKGKLRLPRWGKHRPQPESKTYLNETHIEHLRCANFFENLNWGLHTPYRADIKLPYRSSYEVAYLAVDYLKYLDFTGISLDELGKEWLLHERMCSKTRCNI
jgi:hypothetical protein